MATIDDISKAARELTPEDIRERLQENERESKVLRALLRAVIQSRSDASSASKRGAQR